MVPEFRSEFLSEFLSEFCSEFFRAIFLGGSLLATKRIDHKKIRKIFRKKFRQPHGECQIKNSDGLAGRQSDASF